MHTVIAIKREMDELFEGRVTSLFDFEFEGLLAALRRDHAREEEASRIGELLQHTCHAKYARLDVELLELLNPKAMTLQVPLPVVLSASAA